MQTPRTSLRPPAPDCTSYVGKGISSGQQVYQLFRNMTLKYPSNISFNQLAIPFRAIATDAQTGEAYVLQDGNVTEAMRASMSLPGIFDTFEIIMSP